MRSIKTLLFLTLFSTLIPATAYQITSRIIGGKAANSNEWPWMTALVYQGHSATTGLFCGGSLIAKDWVLTAAHCMYDGENKESPNSIEVIINTANLNSLKSETRSIAEIHVHPDFDHYNLNNDIALLKLGTPSTVTPIEILPANSSQDEAGQTGIALGWGNTSTRRSVFPSDLQQVALPIISNTACSYAMTGIIDSMVCAGRDTGGVDTCEGDSGGPLLVFDIESQTWRQAGVTSFGESKCAARGFYGVYTRTDNFNDFISDTICTAEQIPTAPTLNTSLNNTQINASWNPTLNTTHYRLNYAPYPAGYPIASLEMNQSTDFSVNLTKDSAFYVAITAYNGNCKSGYSNIEYFVVH